MRGYLIRRVLSAVPTLIGISLVTFCLLELLPGREMALAGAREGTPPSAETLARLRLIYHLDDPLPQRYLAWLLKFCRWDLGESLLDGRPVARILGETAARTLVLNLLALGLAFAVAIPLGARWAASPGSLADRAGSFLLYLLYAFPAFAAAVLLQQWLAVKLGVFPLQGLGSLPSTSPVASRMVDYAAHLFLPVICLAYGSLAYLARFTRANVLEGLRSEYVTAARARGLPETVLLWRHAFRNSVLPLLTLIGVLVPALLGGSVLVETVFSWPGMGRLYFEALQNRDYPVVLGLAALTAILTLAGSLLADLLYSVADPRIQVERGIEDRAF